MSTSSTPASPAKSRILLDTLSHPLKYGDRTEIKNRTEGGKIISEGWAVIVGACERADYYLVQFPDGEEVERYVSNVRNAPQPRAARKVDPAIEKDSPAARRKRVIRALKKLAAQWPDDLWLFAANGTLCLMENKNGKRAMTPKGGVNPAHVLETFPKITCDGGDW